jgi:hypothetical protein
MIRRAAFQAENAGLIPAGGTKRGSGGAWFSSPDCLSGYHAGSNPVYPANFGAVV